MKSKAVDVKGKNDRIIAVKLILDEKVLNVVCVCMLYKQDTMK